MPDTDAEAEEGRTSRREIEIELVPTARSGKSDLGLHPSSTYVNLSITPVLCSGGLVVEASVGYGVCILGGLANVGGE